MKYFKMLLFYSAFLYYIGQVIGYNIDLKSAHDNIERLRRYLNDKDQSNTDDTDQKFAKLLDSFKEEGEKKLLFSQIVPMYLKMLNSVEVAEVKDNNKVKDSITNLSQMLHHSNEDFLKQTSEKLKSLFELKEMKVTDVKVQRSAIKELLRILRDIFDLQHQRKPDPQKCKRESRRRRRGC
ncbi:interferon gamma [Pyxicephalus adspersus]|uniref:interferon gamma n=1 Tax=Pyxicephalus adspersus TaxID=30357 RepID=UPI003B595222